MGRVNRDKDSSEGVLAWLDGYPNGSVLYVCFGSQKLLKRVQMEALALGLERSEGADAVPDSAELAQTIAKSLSGNTV
ncbi:UDP-glycosyltransferase 89A2 [Camellia lanceoleosa]|uniref:UDP-glycosyltransferase 89A2 n=1 Tax=Camellia lanceoleosa TaxID=1840588 RepID=A0ACC0I9G8_9ERIC|nr:UDP-glycosyltransferase 89A2 [Camellia lanceoleosa]